MSAGKVTSSVLTVLRFGTRAFSLCDVTRIQQEIDKNYVLPIFPTLAAKFLPLKMLTVLSFLIFPYSYPFPGGFWKMPGRADVPHVFGMPGRDTFNF